MKYGRTNRVSVGKHLAGVTQKTPVKRARWGLPELTRCAHKVRAVTCGICHPRKNT